jgi:hypothetical protein
MTEKRQENEIFPVMAGERLNFKFEIAKWPVPRYIGYNLSFKSAFRA